MIVKTSTDIKYYAYFLLIISKNFENEKLQTGLHMLFSRCGERIMLLLIESNSITQNKAKNKTKHRALQKTGPI